MDFWRHGVPSVHCIIHDRAPEVLSDIVQDITAIFGLQQLPTSRDHPQMDGLVERLNRTRKANQVSEQGRKRLGLVRVGLASDMLAAMIS